MEIFGFPLSPSDSDCFIIPRSSFTRKDLVRFNPVVLDDSPGGMETPSRFTTTESIRYFREVNKLYSDEDESQIIVEPMGEEELVTTVNGEEPHYFYMYDDVIRTFNLWFPFTGFEDTVLRILNIAPSQLHPNSWTFVKAFEIVCMGLGVEPRLGVFFSFYQVKSLTPGKMVSLSSLPNKGLFTLFASNFKNYQDTFFRMRHGPQLPTLMYDGEGGRLFPFYWTSDPSVVKGVHDAHLTAFERETITFLDSFCRLDTKDLLQRETNVDSIVEYLKRMRTVSEGDLLSYLVKLTQKKIDPDEPISPEIQLVVGEKDGAKDAKRKRRGEVVRPSKFSKKDGGSSSQIIDLGASGSSPQPKGGRSLRNRPKPAKDASLKDVTAEVIKDVVSHSAVEDAPPPPVAEDGGSSSAWDKSFDPIAFVERNLLLEGDSSRFDSMSTPALQALALNHGVKNLVLGHLLSARQMREHVDVSAEAKYAGQAVLEAEARHSAEKERLSGEINAIKKEHEAAIAKAKKDHDDAMTALKKKYSEERRYFEKEVKILTLTRNAFIVSCFQIEEDLWEMQGLNEELEEANEGLKQSMADKYVEGFRSSITQVKALFPDIDQEMLAQAGPLKKVEDGKLVSRLPKAD
ncbi:zinc finger protein [Trifolium medium]|uniref:Zinc finger protein n=1 Tax=Trifolium medium TaxID=97028 RepID=A0A392LXF4_9FABA|nr:zinc finger protein [Trifolium medium]